MSSVAIVLDKDCGPRLASIADMQPVWVWTSPANAEAANSLWSSGKFPADRLTIFCPINSIDSAEEAFLYILGTVDQHHPGWSELDVIGLQPTTRVKQSLSSYGAGVFKCAQEGFVYLRAAKGAQVNE